MRGQTGKIPEFPFYRFRVMDDSCNSSTTPFLRNNSKNLFLLNIHLIVSGYHPARKQKNDILPSMQEFK